MSNIKERFIHQPEVQELIGHDAITKQKHVSQRIVPVKLDSESHEGEQWMHLGVADPSGTEPKAVIIMPVSWSDYSKRPFQEARVGTMAEFTGCRVISIDFPGMGGDKSKKDEMLTEKQVEELEKGRMTHLADTNWQALKEADVLKDNKGEPLPVALWGNSLSTLTISEMALTAPPEVVITDAYFCESMALGKVAAGSLVAKFFSRGPLGQPKYLKMNEGLDIPSTGLGDLVLQVLRQKQSHWLTVKALARGQQAHILDQAYKVGGMRTGPEETKLTVVRSEKGLVVERDHLALLDMFKNAHEMTLRGERHAIQDSLPALLQLLGGLSVMESR